MSSVRVSNVATILACSGFVIAGLVRVALDFMRFHAIAPALHWPLDTFATKALIVGVAASVMAIREFAQARSGNAAASPGGSREVLGAILLILSFSLSVGYVMHSLRGGLTGEARLWFDMGVHALVALPGLVTVLLWHQSGRRMVAAE